MHQAYLKLLVQHVQQPIGFVVVLLLCELSMAAPHNSSARCAAMSSECKGGLCFPQTTGNCWSQCHKVK